jgi:hypothetical protein
MRCKAAAFFLLVIFVPGSAVPGPAEPPDTSSAVAPHGPVEAPASQSRRIPDDMPTPIQDNAFLVEEAYNQERGVVQHIGTFQRHGAGEWQSTFTQEWPWNPAPRHQLSYTLEGLGVPLEGHGPGDLLLNWRYQWLGDARSTLALAPRVTLSLPTGDHRRERGRGGLAAQVNLPLSLVHGRRLVTHWNAGATLTPRARNVLDATAATSDATLSQGIVWLAHERVNLLVETVFDTVQRVVAPGSAEREHSVLVVPGLRWSHDCDNGLQIVPGIGVPIGVGPSRGERGLFLYLSLEHPFSRPRVQ